MESHVIPVEQSISWKIKGCTLFVLMSGLLMLSACFDTGKDEPPPGWTSSQLGELGKWYYENVTTKMSTIADRGDNAKKMLGNCIARKLANEYSHDEYWKAWKALDAYLKENHIRITTLEESTALGKLHPVHARTGNASSQCEKELGI